MWYQVLEACFHVPPLDVKLTSKAFYTTEYFDYTVILVYVNGEVTS